MLFCVTLILFSGMDVVAKYLTSKYPPLQVVWARYASQFFWTLIVLSPRLRELMKTEHLLMQLVRSACLFAATMCFFSSLKYLAFAEATAIFEIAPLVITILSVVILKEKVGIRRWLGVTAGLIGALIIIRPGAEVFTPAAIFPVGAAIFFAAYSIATRFLGQDEPAATSFLYTTLIGTIAGSMMVGFVWQPPDTIDIPIMATFGIIGACGHILLIIALNYAQASVIAPFSYLALLLNAVWGMLIFGEMPDAYTWIGATVIVGAGLYVWHRENKSSVT